MAEIIDLDELVPDDIEYTWKGQTYVLPGDIDVATTFRLAKLLRKLTAAEEALVGEDVTEAMHDECERITLDVEEELLKLMQARDATLEKLPFGVQGFRVLLMHVLMKLGFQATEPEPRPLPKRTVPRKRKPRKRT